MEENKITKCLNCGTEFEGKFCPECAQRADTERFTIRHIFKNFIQALLSNDGGVWVTVKSLFTRPGQMVIDILNGKRKSYFSPFPMLLLTLSVYVLIFTFTGSKRADYEKLVSDQNTTEVVEDKELTDEDMMDETITELIMKSVSFAATNYTAVFLLTIPVYILSARISFGKKNRKKYYWGEYCIPMVYSLIMVVLYQCVMSIAFYFSADLYEKMGHFTTLVHVIGCTACFHKMMGFRIVKMVWRSFLTIALYLTIVISLAVCAIIAYATTYYIS